MVSAFYMTRGQELEREITLADLHNATGLGIEVNTTNAGDNIWNLVLNTKHLLNSYRVLVDFAERTCLEAAAYEAFSNITDYDRNSILRVELNKDYSSLAFCQFAQEFRKTLSLAIKEGEIISSPDRPIEDLFDLSVEIFSIKVASALKSADLNNIMELYYFIKPRGLRSLLNIPSFKKSYLEEIELLLGLYRLVMISKI